MTTLEVVYGVVGGFFTLCIGTLAWFAIRLVNQNDEFQRQTKTNIDALRSGITSQKGDIRKLKEEISKEIKSEGLDKETKAKIQAITLSLAKVEKALNTKIIPWVDIAEDDHGKVMVLEDKLRSQEKQLKTLYDTVKLLIQKKR